MWKTNSGKNQFCYEGIFASEDSGLHYYNERKIEKQNCCEANSLGSNLTSKYVKLSNGIAKEFTPLASW